MDFSVILFDLDGTLTDPAEGITNSVIYALKKMGIAPPPRQELLKFIGPPLTESFEKYYKLSREDAVKAVELYREYFKPKGIYENTVIEGAVELLAELKGQGKRLILATSKPKLFADEILKHFDLSKYFDFTVGSNLDGTLTDKAEVIGEVIKALGGEAVDKIAMIGDREHDVIGAVKNGIFPIGVLCGYGSRAELEQCGAKYLAEDLAELREYLCN